MDPHAPTDVISPAHVAKVRELTSVLAVGTMRILLNIPLLQLEQTARDVLDIVSATGATTKIQKQENVSSVMSSAINVRDQERPSVTLTIATGQPMHVQMVTTVAHVQLT